MCGCVGWSSFKAWRAWECLETGEYDIPATLEDGWVAIAVPEGWTDGDTARLREFLDPQQ